MKFISRILVVVVVVAVGLLAQSGLLAYLEAPGPIPPGELQGELTEIPLEIGDWIGKDLPLDESVRYQDPIEYLNRGYVNRKTGQVVYLWAVFSSVGEDRGHHPDVCLPVAGKAEDKAARAHVEVYGHKQPVQQLRYGEGSDKVFVYYWHYTLPSPKKAELDSIQKIYHAQQRLPASITLEVFAEDKSPQTAPGAIEFVRLVDALVQPIAGADARRGCDRMTAVLN